MKEYIYPAIFHKNDDGSFTVTFPDLPGCITEGKTMGDAIKMAQSALTQWIEFLRDEKEDIPNPSNISDLNISNGTFADEGETIISFVDIDSTEYRRKIDTKTVRRNVALPSWLNYEADQAGVNVSRILQEALMSTLKLERRM